MLTRAVDRGKYRIGLSSPSRIASPRIFSRSGCRYGPRGPPPARIFVPGPSRKSFTSTLTQNFEAALGALPLVSRTATHVGAPTVGALRTASPGLYVVMALKIGGSF